MGSINSIFPRRSLAFDSQVSEAGNFPIESPYKDDFQNYPSDRFSILFTILGCTNNFSGMLASIISIGSWRNLTFFWGTFMLIFVLHINYICSPQP